VHCYQAVVTNVKIIVQPADCANTEGTNRSEVSWLTQVPKIIIADDNKQKKNLAMFFVRCFLHFRGRTPDICLESKNDFSVEDNNLSINAASTFRVSREQRPLQ